MTSLHPTVNAELLLRCAVARPSIFSQSEKITVNLDPRHSPPDALFQLNINYDSKQNLPSLNNLESCQIEDGTAGLLVS